MNDEIKEILDFLQYNDHIGTNDKRKLRDYITNLQQENQDLSRMCELYGKSLYNAELTDYKSKIEKAIKYMKSNSKISLDDTTSIINFYRQLLNILNGRSDE